MKISSIKQLAVGTLLICAAQATSAESVDLGEQIVNGEFVTLSSWTVSGSTTTVGPGDAINTGLGNTGFGGFFTSSFAVLGDNSGALGGGPNAGISSISQTFVLADAVDGSHVSSYDLDISFFSAFDGDDSSVLSVVDIFSLTFNGDAIYIQDSRPLPDCGISTTCTENQQVQNPFSTTLTGLAPGTYTISFILDEAITTTGGTITNTAAGVDDISIIATAHVPEPGTLALLGLGLLGLAWRKLPSNRV